MTMPRAESRSLRRRRRRMAFAIGVAVVVFVVGVGAAAIALFGENGSSASSDATRTTSVGEAPGASTTVAPSTAAPTTTTTLAPGTIRPIDTSRRYAVGTGQATFVDHSRATSPNGDFGGAPNRTIPVEFWYPAEGATGAEAVGGAAADRAHGPYPLILFSHGYDVTPDFYRPMLERWAAAGYVVAAPVYPILSGTPGGASHVDYEQTFGDARFVIDQVLALPSSDAMGGLVDPARIGAAGHSDGEVIAFAEGLLQCCRDARVKSVVAMAGDLSNANNPHVRNLGLPILHVMETNDEYDPYQHSIDWDRENLDAPRWMLSLLGASHVPPYTQPGNPAFELVSTSTIAFFDGTLKGHPEQLDAIAAAVHASPDVASLER
jgi:dienelactone hydrolase